MSRFAMPDILDGSSDTQSSLFHLTQSCLTPFAHTQVLPKSRPETEEMDKKKKEDQTERNQRFRNEIWSSRTPILPRVTIETGLAH
jgi:hypothetical protein